MKPLSLFLLLFVAISIQSFGQSPNARWETGIETGPSYISMKEPYESYFEKKGMGFSAGIFIRYNAPKVFSVKLAPAFERKGYWHGEGHYNFDYFVVPLLFQAEYGSKVRVFVDAGPFAGYLLQAKTTAEYFGDNNYMSHLDRFDAGVSAGLGIRIPVGKAFILSAEWRNNFGLVQIVTEADSQEYAWEWKTFSSNLLFGISYCFGKK